MLSFIFCNGHSQTELRLLTLSSALQDHEKNDLDRDYYHLTKSDLILSSSTIDQMLKIYTWYENRTEIYTFYENRFENYTCILIENRTEISNILSMVDGLTTR